MQSQQVSLLHPVAKYIVELASGGIQSQTLNEDFVDLGTGTGNGTVGTPHKSAENGLVLEVERETRRPKDPPPLAEDDHDSQVQRNACGSAAHPPFPQLLMVGIVASFLANVGGTHPVLFFTAFLGSLFLSETVVALQTWWLGDWASQYSSGPITNISASRCVFHVVGRRARLILGQVYWYLW